MIFQLTVFSLVTLVLLLIAQFNTSLGAGPAGSRFGRNRPAAERGERLDAVIRDALRTYVFFASYALLLYLQGKPDLLPQYLAWLVIAIALLKGVALFFQRVPYVRLLGAVNVAVLLLLWVQELPLFRSAPA